MEYYYLFNIYIVTEYKLFTVLRIVFDVEKSGSCYSNLNTFVAIFLQYIRYRRYCIILAAIILA